MRTRPGNPPPLRPHDGTADSFAHFSEDAEGVELSLLDGPDRNEEMIPASVQEQIA